jgi:hypothetical protein
VTTSAFDASELRQFADDLDKSVVEVARGIRGIMAKAGVNIKRQMRAEMESSEHFKGAAHRISYDITTPSDDTAIVEVGPTHGAGDPGSLGNVAYFGTSRGGGTVPDPMGALEAEAAVTEAYFAKLLGGLL